ncbi:MAG: right-handed parallel beta-helix repeat-containing protein, partial [Candidatus Thermoplasmatota archaeon]
NYFTNNLVSIITVFSSPKIESNKITLNKLGGIVTAALSSPKITNNQLSYQGFGILVAFYSSPTIQGNEIKLNARGIHSQEASPNIIDNEIFNNYENLVFESSTVSVIGNRIDSGLRGLYLNYSSGKIEENEIYSNLMEGILLNCSSPHINKNKIYSNSIGLRINSSSPNVESNEINSNILDGINARDASFTISKSKIYSNGGSGVVLENSYMKIINSSFSKNLVFDTMLSSSFIDALNTTINRDRAYFEDSISILNISWYVDINVILKGYGVDGANIEIRNSNDKAVYYGMTDSMGWVRWVVVQEASIRKLGEEKYTPHKIKAKKESISGAVNEVIDKSKVVRIILDDIFPTIKITYPKDNHIQNYSQLLVKGIANDNIGIDIIEVEVLGKEIKHAYGKDEWEANFILEDGEYTISARAIDLAGNIAEDKINVSIDTIPPILEVLTPKKNMKTNNSILYIHGYTEHKTNVFVNGNLTSIKYFNLTRALFELTINIYEGDNYIEIIAMDLAGNVNFWKTIVILDTIPPMLCVTYPASDLITNKTEISIVGFAELDAIVFINGFAPLLNKKDSYEEFDFKFILSEGENLIIISAMDECQNLNETKRIVFLDTIPPTLKLIEPKDKALANKTEIAIIGESDSEKIEVNGKEFPVQEGKFNFSFLLSKEGENFIIFIAKDFAGNKNSLGITIIRDTIPPTLVIYSPIDGARIRGNRAFVGGKTEPNATLLVNDRNLVLKDSEFKTSVPISIGKNKITVCATDIAGNKVFVELTVFGEKSGETFICSLDVFFILFIIIILIFLISFLVYRKAKAIMKEKGESGGKEGT